jgi:hypothetical protein
MRLTKLALLAIKGGKAEMIKKLSEALHTSEAAIYRYIKENDDELTKAAALMVIKQETGLLDDQILEQEPEEARK